MVRLDLDVLYKPVSVQSWTQSTTTQSFWTILSASLNGMTERAAEEPQLCAANMKLLHNLRKREGHFHTVQKPQNSSQYSGQDTYEGTRPWLARTQWIVTYQDVPRDILKRLSLLPAVSSIKHGLQLGFFRDRALLSPPADEGRIYHLVAGIDDVLDRCEETMRRTGHPILARLKSHTVTEPSSRPFSFLETPQGRQRCRRT
ncbi:hypothetical protein N7476_003716 [Penicillium atrosanguineum]|uniref:Uncharacterized protein n=1 Tax=Penicillium atrosanguineum TaxID=1132637 RepID=A0A9W9Q101_9EURO|nr:hypothetical protein N7526_003415 [Penicillium atrosanguineum]KAJ5320714.1 hypothetical protein N7476_003716 [Penicillium atrosanguineum]